MSGGGGGKKNGRDDAATTNLTPMVQGGQTQTFPSGFPGQLQAQANQMAMGYGGQPADIMAMLSAMYKPMTLPQIAPYDPARAATIAKEDPLKSKKSGK